MKKDKLMKAMPWLLIFGGFYLLPSIPWVLALGCMVIGITMLIERMWPEQWGTNRTR